MGERPASCLTGSRYCDPQLYELDEETTRLIMGQIRNQRWSHAWAKPLLGRYVQAHYKENGLPFTIIRVLNLFGPGMDVIPGLDGISIPSVWPVL